MKDSDPQTTLREQIAQILVKNNLRTDQVAILELVRLVAAHDVEIRREALEEGANHLIAMGSIKTFTDTAGEMIIRSLITKPSKEG